MNINAKKARELTVSSQRGFENMMKDIDTAIKERAVNGYDNVKWSFKEHHTKEFRKQVLDELVIHGYNHTLSHSMASDNFSITW
jgi:hypothetical protein